MEPNDCCADADVPKRSRAPASRIMLSPKSRIVSLQENCEWVLCSTTPGVWSMLKGSVAVLMPVVTFLLLCGPAEAQYSAVREGDVVRLADKKTDTVVSI